MHRPEQLHGYDFNMQLGTQALSTMPERISRKTHYVTLSLKIPKNHKLLLQRSGAGRTKHLPCRISPSCLIVPLSFRSLEYLLELSLFIHPPMHWPIHVSAQESDLRTLFLQRENPRFLAADLPPPTCFCDLASAKIPSREKNPPLPRFLGAW